ncbi:PREDICTED: DNA fragmentation factor subunit beta isoform X2 [Chinchilla lanigera]|uniref:DNA fragmentation factor subunit beta isoform X2 n=1 Tax=Chinchilla lanigera TaxID=34839 RepID=UPI00038EDAA3|nr:PREDICTED: DNA fragmentation factor subunit beta isoform X2 [Chinchilla lanigera]
MCAVQRRPKTFRLRDLHSARKFGVAGHTCQEVLRKGCLRFQVPERGSRLCLCEDGTEVTEDYFPGVPDDAELVLLTAGQTWGGYVSDIGRLLSVFQEPHTGAIQAVRQLLADERAPLRKKLLADLLQSASQNMEAETRAEDPPWFEGLESRFRNKSGYLRYSCESRIRGYLREMTGIGEQGCADLASKDVLGAGASRTARVHVVTGRLPSGSPDGASRGRGLVLARPAVEQWHRHGQGLCPPCDAVPPGACEGGGRLVAVSFLALRSDWVTTYASQVDVGAREEFLRVLGSMCKKLKAAQYHGSYFDRGAEASGRLCTPEGWFSCQGPFDLEDCVSKHSINPYSNRESRILFSTWNLDHMMDRTAGLGVLPPPTQLPLAAPLSAVLPSPTPCLYAVSSLEQQQRDHPKGRAPAGRQIPSQFELSSIAEFGPFRLTFGPLTSPRLLCKRTDLTGLGSD